MAALSSITNLLPKILVRCPGVEENHALSAIRTALQRFAVDTLIWRETLTITSVEDQDNYELAPDTDNTRIERIISVTPLNDDGEEMAALPLDAYRQDITNDELIFESGYVPAADDDEYHVVIAIRPEWQAANDTFPTWMLDKWGRGIAGGAIAELLLGSPFLLASADQRVRDALNEYGGAVSGAKAWIRQQGTIRQAGLSVS